MNLTAEITIPVQVDFSIDTTDVTDSSDLLPLNTIPVGERLRTETLIDDAFISDWSKNYIPSKDVIRSRIIAFLNHKRGCSFTRLQLYSKVCKEQASGLFQLFSNQLDEMLENELIDIVDAEYAYEYTFAEIKASAIQEIEERHQEEVHMAWLPKRWK